jgi:hypothetical protein
MKEIFKDIIGYEGIYQVSNLGNVKSFKRNKEKLLSPCAGKSGYKHFIAIKQNKRKTLKVHQEVAKCFLGHVQCGYNKVVNHINFNKTDNRVENLEIVTTRENSNKKHLKSSSDYIGVSFVKNSSKWCSRIVFNGVKINLGTFSNEKEAAKYYDDALNSINNNTEIKIKRRTYTSKYKNVFYDKSRNKWQARAFVNKKTIILGRFNSEIEAYNKTIEVPKVSKTERKSSLSISF